MGGACGTYGSVEKFIQVFMGKPEIKRPFGRPRPKWEDSIETCLQEIGYGACTGLIWLRIGTGVRPL